MLLPAGSVRRTCNNSQQQPDTQSMHCPLPNLSAYSSPSLEAPHRHVLVTRKQFEDMSRPLLQRLMDPLDHLAASTKLEWAHSSTLSSWQVFLHAQMRTLKSASHLVLQFRSGLAATLPS